MTLPSFVLRRRDRVLDGRFVPGTASVFEPLSAAPTSRPAEGKHRWRPAVTVADEAQEGVHRVERIAQLEAELAAHRQELGEMRLQLDILATIDPTTGLLNRNGILDAVDAAARRQGRTGEPFGLLLIAIPELRRIRAVDGELLYVDVLRDISALVTASMRDMDRVGRVDDMTLLALLPWVGEDGMPQVRSRIGRILRGRDSRLRPSFTSVIASPHGRVDPDDLLAVLVGVAIAPPAETTAAPL